jgi:hypothetical protein
MYYLRQPTILINLVIMSYMWACCSFTYYMIAFQLKYLPGNIYNNNLSSTVSEFGAIILSGFMYKKLGLKLSFTILLSISVVGGLLIIFFGSDDSKVWMPIFVLFAKFGISGGFNLSYCSTVYVFPTLFCATALGMCNFFARLLTIFAPFIAEYEPPLPMALFTGLAAFGIIVI